MFEFESYCDDSGTDGNSEIAVGACYVSSKAQWDEFVRNWDDVGRDEGFDFFHMAEYVAKRDAGHEPFCHWDNAKKDRVYARLASIINTRVRKGFGIAVPKEPYDRVAPKWFKDRFASDHYTYAVHCCISLLGKWKAKYSINSPVQYVFDQGSPQRQIRAVWDVLAPYPPTATKFGLHPEGWSFQDKKIFKPLQAADILAWQIRNHMRRVIASGKDDVKDCHPGFRMLRQNRPVQIGWITEQQMKVNFARLEAHRDELSDLSAPAMVIPNLI
jgi:Protein of unknown function (DUF3800)